MGVWLGGWVDAENNATLWPILQAKAFQIFSLAEISRWTECGKNTQGFENYNEFDHIHVLDTRSFKFNY